MQPADDFDPMSQFTGTIAGDARDPYPALHEARRRCPAEIVEGIAIGVEQRATDLLNVYSFEHVSAVLRDPATFESSLIREHIGKVMGRYVLVGLDGEEHRVRRRLISSAFVPRSLERWESELVRPTVHRLIDGFAHRGQAELVRDFTFQFPVFVIAGMLGVPEADRLSFRDHALSVVSFSADPARGMAAATALRSYFAGLVESSRRAPGDDLIGHLVQAELDGERLADDEIASFLLFLLPAGVETTYRAAGNLLFGLLSNPDQFAELRARRELVHAAVEEALRWEPPMVRIPRITACPVDMAGVAVPARTEVSYFIGAANRDETRWPEPDRFDMHREARPHLAFGQGVHFCLGIHLARMEMREAVLALMDRLPDLRLSPDAEAMDAHIHGERFRSPTSLPVIFTPMA